MGLSSEALKVCVLNFVEDSDSESSRIVTLTPPHPNRSTAFRTDIEGLRAIAVLFVVAFHCRFPGVSGGFIGVDVFFVLSGYLITGLLISEWKKSSRIDLLQFYARRGRRLLPAFTLTMLVTLAVASVIMTPQELSFASRAARASALYMSNMFFAYNSADYFAPSVETNPVLHTWSLAVEEQFYLFWPLLIMLGLQFWKSRRALFGILLTLTVISFAICLWQTRTAGTLAFYGLPARAWEFGIGGLAVMVPARILMSVPVSWLAVGWLGFAGLLASIFFISSGSSFPGWIALSPVIATTAVLLAESLKAGTGPRWGVGRLLAIHPLQVLGSLSYSWYLWHWPFLVFATVLFPNISLPGKLTTVAVALAAAAITHVFVENPIRFLPKLVAQPALMVALTAGVTLTLLIPTTMGVMWAAYLGNTPKMKSITAAASDMGKLPRQRCVTSLDSPDVRTCVFGNESSETHIVLFGDSHAIQWFNPLQEIALTHNWKLTTVVKSGCPATDIGPLNTRPQAKASCLIWRPAALQTVVQLRPSIVFVGNATTYLRNDRTASGESVSFSEWREGTRRTMQTLTSAGLQVVAMRDNPISPFDVPVCLARSVRQSWRSTESCEMDRHASLDPKIFEAEQAGTVGLRNVQFLDLTDEYCEDSTCMAKRGELILYRDDNHLTGRFTETLMPVLEAKLLPLLGDR